MVKYLSVTLVPDDSETKISKKGQVRTGHYRFDMVLEEMRRTTQRLSVYRI